jgi:hypothetical protein
VDTGNLKLYSFYYSLGKHGSIVPYAVVFDVCKDDACQLEVDVLTHVLILKIFVLFLSQGTLFSRFVNTQRHVDNCVAARIFDKRDFKRLVL